MKNFWQRIVGCFIAGVLAILPLAITIGIVVWVTDFIGGFIGPETTMGGWLSSIGLQFTATKTFQYFIGWIVVLGAVFALGIAMELGAKGLIEKLLEGLISRIPLLGSLYTTAKQMVKMVDKKDDDVLKGMSPVYCFFGEDRGAGVLALLVTPDKFTVAGREVQIVVIPTAPVPFGGGLFFIPADRVEPVDMPVDGLMSIYISMGVTAPEYLAASKGDAASK